jgi:hypothetical protein
MAYYFFHAGLVEQNYHNDEGLNKFDQRHELRSPVYQNEQVKIYQVHVH